MRGICVEKWRHDGAFPAQRQIGWRKSGSALHGISVHHWPSDATASAGISFLSIGCFAPIGGEKPFAKMASKSSVMSRWDYSIPDTQSSGKTGLSKNVQALRHCWGAHAISLGSGPCREWLHRTKAPIPVSPGLHQADVVMLPG